jgi:hypothetical protein
MKVIRDSITRGVAAPLKRNLILRFTKGGGSTWNNEEYLNVDEEIGISG